MSLKVTQEEPEGAPGPPEGAPGDLNSDPWGRHEVPGTPRGGHGSP